MIWSMVYGLCLCLPMYSMHIRCLSAAAAKYINNKHFNRVHWLEIGSYVGSPTLSYALRHVPSRVQTGRWSPGLDCIRVGQCPESVKESMDSPYMTPWFYDSLILWLHETGDRRQETWAQSPSTYPHPPIYTQLHWSSLNLSSFESCKPSLSFGVWSFEFWVVTPYCLIMLIQSSTDTYHW